MAAQLAKDRPRAYLDFDVDDACAKFKRASHFVESCDLKYALSSKKIDELGGGEVLRLPELYSNDYEWTAKGAMQARPQPNCRVVFELYEDIAPLAVENFLALCRGDRGVDKGSGVKLHYKGCPVHRVVKGLQCLRNLCIVDVAAVVQLQDMPNDSFRFDSLEKYLIQLLRISKSGNRRRN